MNEMINNDGFAPVSTALVASSKLTTLAPTSVDPSVATDADSSEEKQAIALAQTTSKPSIDSTVIALEMTVDEARQKIKAIKSHTAEIRTLLLELDSRQGWKALGYNSMHELIKGELKGKLDKSPSQLYRELNAARIEHTVSHGCEKLGTIPERHLEPLGNLQPEEWSDAWNEINTTAPATTGVTRRHAQDVVNRRCQRQKHNSEKPNFKPNLSPSDLTADQILRIKCDRGATLEQRKYNNCWGIVSEVTEFNVILTVGGERMSYPPKYLKREDNADRDVCNRVIRLLSVPNLPLSVQYLLKTFFQQQLNLQPDDSDFLLEIERLYPGQDQDQD